MAREKPKAGRVLSDAEMARKYPTSGIASKITVIPSDALWLPSRSMQLNYVLGGGIPYGKNCELFGSESSGKSLAAMDFGYCAQYLGGWIIWDDAEQSFDPAWAVANGLDLDRILLSSEVSIEKVSDWVADCIITLRSKLKRNEPILLVVDSIAALDCDINISSVQFDAKAEMGNRAKAFYKFLRIRNQMLAKMGVCSIFINQLRSKVGATKYEDPDTTPGGSAMKFFASQRVAFFKKKQITVGSNDNKVWIGNEVSVRMKKNKVAPPRSTFTTEIYFNEEHHSLGFSRYYGLAHLIEMSGAVERKKGGSRYYYKDAILCNGEAAFQKLLEEDSDLRKVLLRKGNINTLSRTEAKIERLNKKGENRYPVNLGKQARQKDVDDIDDEEEDYDE